MIPHDVELADTLPNLPATGVLCVPGLRPAVLCRLRGLGQRADAAVSLVRGSRGHRIGRQRNGGREAGRVMAAPVLARARRWAARIGWIAAWALVLAVTGWPRPGVPRAATATWTGPGVWIPAAPPTPTDAIADDGSSPPAIGVWVASGAPGLTACWPRAKLGRCPAGPPRCLPLPQTVLVTTATRVTGRLRPGWSWARVTARATSLPAVSMATALTLMPPPRPAPHPAAGAASRGRKPRQPVVPARRGGGTARTASRAGRTPGGAISDLWAVLAGEKTSSAWSARLSLPAMALTAPFVRRGACPVFLTTRMLWLSLKTWPRLRVEHRPFRPLLTPGEQEAVWHAFAARGAWDGPTVRLIAWDANGWIVALSSYRAWCESHGLAGWPAPPPGASASLVSAWRRIQRLPPPSSWSDLLIRPGWANTLGLMGFCQDPTGQVWAARRSPAVVDEPGAWTATVTGTVEPRDLADPVAGLAAACWREIREEIGVEALPACTPSAWPRVPPVAAELDRLGGDTRTPWPPGGAGWLGNDRVRAHPGGRRRLGRLVPRRLARRSGPPRGGWACVRRNLTSPLGASPAHPESAKTAAAAKDRPGRSAVEPSLT